MDGGVAGQPESPREQAFPATRAEADAATLESDPYLDIALSHLREAITEVAQTRWAARTPQVVAAAVRALVQEQARLDAAKLTALHEVETRDDVVPRARSGSSRAAAFLRGMGTDPRRASREAESARLVAGSTPSWPRSALPTPPARSAGGTWTSRSASTADSARQYGTR